MSVPVHNQAEISNTFSTPRAVILSLVLIVLATAIYGRTIGFGFVHFDDPEYVRDNPHVQQGLNPANAAWAFTTAEFGSWNPLVWLSLMIDRDLFGPGAGGFHFTNAALHVINVLLLFIVLRRMTREDWPSAMVAALFAIHPLHVESVAWISERKDVLSTMFWLLTMWVYAGFTERGGATRYLLVMAMMTLGLLAKPMLVTLPCVLLLLDYWPLGRLANHAAITVQNPKTAWQLVIEKLPLFAIAAMASVVTIIAQHGQSAITDLPVGSRLANAVVSYARYLGKQFWPVDLALVYPHPYLHGGPGLPAGTIAAAAALLLVITVITIALARQRPYLIVGWLWFLGTMVPVIGVVQVGYQAMADRYAYVPMIGVYIALAWTVWDLLARHRRMRAPMVVMASIIMMLLGWRAWLQVGHWRNSNHLFDHSLAVMPDNWIMHQHYAGVLERQNDRAGAAAQLEAALRLHPDSAGMNNTLGAIRYALGDATAARQRFLRALDLNPDFAEAHNNLAILDQRDGRLDQAEMHLREAVRIDPRASRTRKNLGLLLGLMGRFDEAVSQIEQAISLDPAHADEYRKALDQVRAMKPLPPATAPH